MRFTVYRLMSIVLGRVEGVEIHPGAQTTGILVLRVKLPVQPVPLQVHLAVLDAGEHPAHAPKGKSPTTNIP